MSGLLFLELGDGEPAIGRIRVFAGKEFVAQLDLLDLAAGGHREFRQLVFRHTPGFEIAHHVGQRTGLARAPDKQTSLFAQPGIRHGHQRHHAEGPIRQQHFLDLAHADLEPAAVDDLFLAADQLDISLLVDGRPVAREQPAILAERLARAFGIVEVPQRHMPISMQPVFSQKLWPSFPGSPHRRSRRCGNSTGHADRLDGSQMSWMTSVAPSVTAMRSPH
ncbi:hypothetical protein SAMN05216376_104116 [Mameliella alba]|uniref:hypothetical protein n=1 Tax=Mameliella alba TaxID=561184 RepID=UPI00088C4BF8|nr:hypothetical protein [Mameliella alba]PTR38262.1 hypothetical protein LX94_02886 [Mameliella alba]SDC78756.1 hypothetical protein SAMN05216376_104116 [Mameliella alba]